MYEEFMSIKLALLKSGEEVIADIKEFRDPDDNLVSYLFENPHFVFVIPFEIRYYFLQLP